MCSNDLLLEDERWSLARVRKVPRLLDNVLGMDSCAVCGTREGLTTHHIVPLGKGGLDERENRMVLCRGHHDDVHRVVHAVHGRRPGSF